MKLILEKNNILINSFSKISILDYEQLKPLLLRVGENVKATIFSYDLSLSCNQLQKIIDVLGEARITLNVIYSSSRETIVSAKSLRVNAILDIPRDKERNSDNLCIENMFDQTHKGTIRSGNKISSNGNLIIIGDVNPGAQISAKKNIYVWGKLCGIAYAGKDGNNTSSISSLYLNPVQLRINNTIAIGPQEKPNSIHPEIAILQKGEIVIKPFIINN